MLVRVSVPAHVEAARAVGRRFDARRGRGGRRLDLVREAVQEETPRLGARRDASVGGPADV